MSASITQCCVCADQILPIRSYEFKSAAFRDVYRDKSIYRCSGCGLVQANVSLVDEQRLTNYYARQYRNVAGISTLSERMSHYYAARGRALAALAQSHATTTPRVAFELGAGYGFNLFELARLYPGLELYTDEVDETINFDSRIKRTTLAERTFDIILLSHVLEHFSNPEVLIRKCLRALSPHGVMIIEVPNDVEGIVGLQGFDEPHLLFFTEHTLEALLSRITPQVVYLSAAGPSYRMKGEPSVRSVIRSVINTPLIAQVVAPLQARRAARLNFAGQNEKGVFLRAVIKQLPQTS